MIHNDLTMQAAEIRGLENQTVGRVFFKLHMDKSIQPAMQWFRQLSEKQTKLCGPDQSTKVIEIGIQTVTIPQTHELVYWYEFYG